MMAVLVFVLIMVSPAFTIWSVNLLAGLSIPLSIETWLATFWVLVLCGVVKFNYKA